MEGKVKRSKIGKEFVYQSADLIFNAIAEGSLDGSSSGGTVSVLLAAQNGVIPDKITAVSTNSFEEEVSEHTTSCTDY